ncbi:MAG: succinate dehydrogenase cytochrome b subunit [Bdellovibrionaceae bacterium]|nr:succinate dehydrogenase cytochrome b subunit [Pseudobdellovibrionaceae bacterium]
MKNYFTSTVGRKQLVAVGGLGLALFLFTHMAANMLILFSPKAYNIYSHKLITNPLIYIAELGLLGLLFLHMMLTMALVFRNWGARKKAYAIRPKGKAAATLSSRTMWFQGSVILLFLISHLLTFKFGEYYSVTYDGVEMRDLHRLVVEVFQNPAYVVGYMFCLVLLYGHLKHGVSSLFQSFGLSNVHEKVISAVGWIYGLVVVGGFISQPIYVYFFYKG